MLLKSTSQSIFIFLGKGSGREELKNVPEKKATFTLCRLYSLRMYTDISIKDKIYKVIILPCITYNCTINLNLTPTQRQKLQTIDLLAEKVIGKKQTSIENEIKKHSVMLVYKFVQKEMWKFQWLFQNPVPWSSNMKQSYLLQIPKTKLKYAKNGWA